MADLFYFDSHNFQTDTKDFETTDVGGKRKNSSMIQQLEDELMGPTGYTTMQQGPPKRTMSELEETMGLRPGPNALNLGSNNMQSNNYNPQQQQMQQMMHMQYDRNVSNNLMMQNHMMQQQNHALQQNQMQNQLQMQGQGGSNMMGGNNARLSFTGDPSMSAFQNMSSYNSMPNNQQRMMMQHHQQQQQQQHQNNQGLMHGGHQNVLQRQHSSLRTSGPHLMNQYVNNQHNVNQGMNVGHNNMSINSAPSPNSPFSAFPGWNTNNTALGNMNSFSPGSSPALNTISTPPFSPPPTYGIYNTESNVHFPGNNMGRAGNFTSIASQSSVAIMQNLSNDDLANIFSFLSLKDISRCSQVCSRWNQLAWKSVENVDLSQPWNFFTNQSAARHVSDTHLRRFFGERLDPNKVRAINAWGCEALSNIVLETLSAMPAYQQNLRSLNVRMTRVTSDGIRHIANFSNLESLTLMNAILDRDIEVLCKRLPRLQRLMIISSNITDASLEEINNLHDLRELQLTGCERITDGGLEKMKGLSNLRTLWLSCTGVTDVGMQHLTVLTNIQTLVLTNCRITDQGLQYLSQLPNLTTLSLSYCYMVTPAGVDGLPKTIHTNLFDLMRAQQQQQRG